MTIKDEHIREAEELLIDGYCFDEDERIPFIKNLSSIDLLAVPGSGKTTALQAKLYCLSRQLPIDDGSGILVLSHTNFAIEEIEKNLRKHCPKLFEYPNFVGTVQSFVNKFLTLPYYSNKNRHKIITIDTGVYANILKNIVLFEKSGVQKEIKRLFRTPKLDWLYNFRIDELPEDPQLRILKTYNNELIEIKNPRGTTKEENYIAWTEQKRRKIEQNLIKIKTDLLTKGILSYEDSYFYAERYLKKYPLIKEILQKRFKYVFVDEMQDLESLQIELIDNIFYSKKASSVIQRIGDINQAIYSSGRKVKVDADWIAREQTQYITGSNRLTPEIASVVNYFTLDPQKDKNGNPRFVVDGLKKLQTIIKPHLILYDQESKDSLEVQFKELIHSFSLHETFEGKKYGFKIIGWNAKWYDEDATHDGKLRLEDIFEHYNKAANEKKESMDSLSKYMQCFDKNKKSLKFAQDNILNSLLTVLKHERKTYLASKKGVAIEKYYTHREFVQHLKLDSNNYSYFKTKLYEWSFSLATKGNYPEVYHSVKDFIENEFKNWFDLSLTQECKEFLGEKYEKIIFNISDIPPNDSQDEIKVDIGTVHSAKGQTHCATMYVETSYNHYETEKLKVTVGKGRNEKVLNNPLYKQEHQYRMNQHKRAKETMKMMYVGFSRPTHLLCFACLRKNVEDDIELFRKAGWEIVDLKTYNEESNTVEKMNFS